MINLSDDAKQVWRIVVDRMDSSGLEVTAVHVLAASLLQLDEQRVNALLGELAEHGLIELPGNVNTPYACIVLTDEGRDHLSAT